METLAKHTDNASYPTYPPTVREAVGIFPDDTHLRAAIDELELEEFARQDISVLGAQDVLSRESATLRNPQQMESDPHTPRGVFVMPEEQSLAEACLVGAGVILTVFFVGPAMGRDLAMAGNVALLLVLALIGAAVGYAAARGLRYLRQRRTEEQQRRGGLLLWVNTPTRQLERKACAILARHGAHDVHINEVVHPPRA